MLSFGMFTNTTSSCSCARKRVRCIAAVKESETKGMHKGILPSHGILTMLFVGRDWVLDFNFEYPFELAMLVASFSDAAIHRTLLRAQLQDDVVLVNIPNDSIKRQLVRNRFYDRQCGSECCVVCPFGKASDCTRVGVI
ncbi:hypothetical protein RB195_022328 [Necator americanus]|uniref:Uncharacterized protein n=1 Tax=Necator americanus TaxID=51031 RepID=A0ABR1EF47_NECAM